MFWKQKADKFSLKPFISVLFYRIGFVPLDVAEFITKLLLCVKVLFVIIGLR